MINFLCSSNEAETATEALLQPHLSAFKLDGKHNKKPTDKKRAISA
jgi:hypothetical protein